VEIGLALIAVVGTLLGVVLGGWMQARREDTAWQRQEGTRWLADVRSLLARYLEATERCWKLSGPWQATTERVENAREGLREAEGRPEHAAKREEVESISVGHREAMTAFANAFDESERIRAEIDLIAGDDLRNAASELANALFAASGGRGTRDEADEADTYWAAREAFVQAGRAELLGMARPARQVLD
jgi:hypothetical protein